MPSSVRVGSRPPSRCLIFSNSSGVRPCSRIISGVMAAIAEVVMSGKSYCRISTNFSHVDSSKNRRNGINTKIEIKPKTKGGGRGRPPHTAVYTVADEVRHRRHGRTYRSREDGAGESPDRHRCRPP